MKKLAKLSKFAIDKLGLTGQLKLQKAVRSLATYGQTVHQFPHTQKNYNMYPYISTFLYKYMIEWAEISDDGHDLIRISKKDSDKLKMLINQRDVRRRKIKNPPLIGRLKES